MATAFKRVWLFLISLLLIIAFSNGVGVKRRIAESYGIDTASGTPDKTQNTVSSETRYRGGAKQRHSQFAAEAASASSSSAAQHVNPLRSDYRREWAKGTLSSKHVQMFSQSAMSVGRLNNLPLQTNPGEREGWAS